MLMDRVGGYTLIEVMIFLAVSGVLFISAVALIQGQQGRTQFSQSIRDIDSKVQQYVDEVSASYFPSTDKYSCRLVRDLAGKDRPNVTTLLGGNTKSVGTNENCIFLGKALQFHSNPGDVDDTLGVYSILGRRTKEVPVTGITGGTQTILVPSFSDANPTPTTSLVETYTLPFGSKVTSACKDVSSCNDSSPNRSAMAGFYVDLSQTSTDVNANKSTSLISYQYPSNVDRNTLLYGPLSSNSTPNGATYNCLILNRSGCGGLRPSSPTLPDVFTNWILCFKSATSNQTAKLTISSGSAGIQTKVDFVSC